MYSKMINTDFLTLKRLVKARVTIVLIFSLMVFISYGQNGDGKLCIDAQPLCAASQFSYPNTFGINFAESGPDFDCISFPINPSWFYLQIAQDGDIQLQLEQSITDGGNPSLDVDFILYGPFNDPRAPCISNLTSANVVDCSYEPNVVEYVDIANTYAGEYYLLMITNFSRLPGYITVSQTAGSATTNCNLLNDFIIIEEIACEGDAALLDATTINADYYTWYKDDGLGTGNFNIISGINTPIYGATDNSIYRAIIYDVNYVILKKYEFNITYIQTPQIPEILLAYNICDTFNSNDGIAEFDLSSKNNEVLNGLNALDFLVTYYKNDNDANLSKNPLPILYLNTYLTETIYVRVENILNNNVNCYDVQSFQITVNRLPEVILADSYLLCINTNGTETIQTPPVIDTELQITNYSFVWLLNGNLLPAMTNGFIFPQEEGEYSVEVTHNTTGCSHVFFTNVVISEPPQVYAEVISYAFNQENNIQVRATGVGIQEYEYKIDNGLWQENNVFSNVSIGEHIITVRNLSGCGQNSTVLMVMDYPLFFTPNGDGYHDTWNIAGLQNQPQAKIYIFDRYGKLIKYLGSNSNGWDGTYNGNHLPSNDYWFVVEYIEPLNGISKQFKAHFTLKR
jgi:gliding motility-associated-like protein